MEDFIQQMIDSYSAAQQQTVFLPVIIAIIAGLLICFFGYRFIRLWCAIIGFAAGALISGLVAYAMGADVVLLVAVVVGIVTALLSFAFYKAGVFVIGFGSTLNIAGHLMNAYGVSAQWWMIILAIVAAVAVGILAVHLVRLVVIITTSLSGAASISTNILGIFNITNGVVILSATGIIAILGMVYQFTHTRKKNKAQPEDETIPEQSETDVNEQNVDTVEEPALPEDDVPSLTENTEEISEDTDLSVAEQDVQSEEKEESEE